MKDEGREVEGEVAGEGCDTTGISYIFTSLTVSSNQ